MHFEVVPKFTYIGSKVSTDNSIEAELYARMLAANILQPEKSFHLKEPVVTVEAGTIHSTYII